jgi:hypothetical protein
VAATWPGECTGTGSGGRPNFSRARRNSCEYAANRDGGPPMMASASEYPEAGRADHRLRVAADADP